ncbi:MAG: hypothetical protein HW388_1642 [Dehalococcoidia bacterium]|nr:hypothetical protein [Dehalococcoidia bacterium]
MGKLPLEGIRVADFTQVIQGPFATMMLAQMGAEVIKIETESRTQGESRNGAGFARLNTSKKSVTLNLKDPRGVEVAKSLVKTSDIVIENFATGVMERLGVGYEELRRVKPDIIMLSSQGLGRTGPLSDAIAYFAEVLNFAGMSHLAGHKDDTPGIMGGMWLDYYTGLLLVLAMLAALHRRQETGEGQYIQVCMAENAIASMPEAFLDYSVNGRDAGPQENRDVAMAPHGAYRSRGFDKWVAIAVTNEEEWSAFCKATGHTEWVKDDRFADPVSRWHHQEELDKLITQWTLQRTDYEAMHILQKAGVAAGPILDMAGLANDPHLNERGFLIPLGEREGKPYLHLTHPWRSSSVPQPFYKLPSEFGADNNYVLGELLGMSEAEIARLAKDNVLS